MRLLYQNVSYAPVKINYLLVADVNPSSPWRGNIPRLFKHPSTMSSCGFGHLIQIIALKLPSLINISVYKLSAHGDVLHWSLTDKNDKGALGSLLGEVFAHHTRDPSSILFDVWSFLLFP